MKFEDKHQDKIYGLLHGFDRIVFRGYLSGFLPEKSMYYYLSQLKIRLTRYNTFVDQQSQKLRTHIETMAQHSGVPIHYIRSPKVSKESIAKQDFEQCSSKTGIISIIKSLEVSPSFRLRGNRKLKELEIIREYRQHLHYYLYYNDAEFGWMYVRIQSWYPFSIQIYVNGKEYLKRVLKKKNIAFTSYNNSVTWVSDMVKAQSISDRLINKNWSRVLDAFAKKVNPHLPSIKKIFGKGYLWVTHQCEYATDVLFRDRQELEQLYPSLVQYATQFRGGEDIYTFFGRTLHGNCKREVTGSTKRFTQGFRVKHYLDKNSIKMYDKYSALRIETTINHTRAYKIYRDAIRDGKKTKAWVPMGKKVTNFYRLAQVAKSSNLKYLNSLATIPCPKRISKELDKVSQKTIVLNKNKNPIQYPALNLLSKDTCLLLEAINDARFTIRPFSNKLLRTILLEKGVFQIDTNDPLAIQKLSSKITRLLSKLRAHRLIKKVNRSFKYEVTSLGQRIIFTILKFKKIELQNY